jgi:hypothetical protein
MPVSMFRNNTFIRPQSEFIASELNALNWPAEKTPPDTPFANLV